MPPPPSARRLVTTRAAASFVLRDWEGAQTNYRAAAADFKNDKAHEPYAAAQVPVSYTHLTLPTSDLV